MKLITKTCALAGTAFILGCSIAVIDISGKDDTAQNVTSTGTSEGYSRAAAVPSSAAGSYLAGRSASLNNDHDKASYYLSYALGHSPQNTVLVRLSLRHAMLRGDLEEALNLIEAHPDNVDGTRLAHLIRLADHLKHGAIEKAHEHAASLKPVGIHALIVPFIENWMAFEATGKVTRVKVADGLSQSSYNVLQHYHQALQYRLQGKDDAARTSYDLALAHLQHTPAAVVLSAIRFYTQVGDTQKAQALATSYKELHDRDSFWRSHNTATLLTLAQDYDGSDVTNTTDGIAELLMNMGTLLQREHTFDESHYFLLLARYLRPEDALSHLSYAQLLEESNRHEEALNVYDSLQENPLFGNIVTLAKARLLHAMERTDEAVSVLKNDVSGTSFNQLVMLGDIARVQKEYRMAIAYYSEALQTLGGAKAHDWNLLYRRGIMYDLAKDWARAENDFKHALELSPNQPQVMNYLAYSWLVRGEHLQKAEKMLQQAVAARPTDAHIIDSYGWAMYKLGHYDKALPFLEQALELFPSDPTINDHYGDVLWQLGRTTEAQYQWERALLFEPPEEKDREAIKKKLSEGIPQHKTQHSQARSVSTK